MKDIKRLTERNAAIAEMLSDGERIKDFYRFVAQNPHINLHDACQIIIARPNASVCFAFNEWNAMGRRITKGRNGIAYYDCDGYKQFAYDATDTHGDSRYQRPIIPMKRLLTGLDELNGTSLYEDERGDRRKIKSGVQKYLQNQDGLSDDDVRNGLLIEGIAYSLYAKTGFPKAAGINLSGLPYSYKENAEFVKEVYIHTNSLVQEIEDAYFRKINEVKIIDDTEEETVSDESVISSAPAGQKDEKEDKTVIFSRSVKMYAQDYVILIDYKRSDEEEETHIYIGKPENLDGEMNAYDNSDDSLVYVTDRPQMPYLLYGKPYAQTQQELIENGTFTVEDYAEYDRLKRGALKEILGNSPLMFGVKKGNKGKPFSYPNWQEEKPAVHTEEQLQVTPLYQKYLDLQKLKPQAVVVMRLGDFYEIMGENAKVIAEELDLTLTGRNVGLPERVPMCGMPYHAMDRYLDKILERHSVLLADGEENPKYILSHIEVAEGTDEDDEELSEQDNEEEFAYEYEQDEPQEKIKSTPKKQEKGIQDRKRRQKPQANLFDLKEPPVEKSREDKFIEQCLKTAYSDYKLKFYDAYQKNLTVTEFAEVMRKAYGQSGSYYDNIGITNGSKGTEFKWDDRQHPEDNFKVNVKWREQALRIAELIENDDYLTAEEKREYARIVRFRAARENAETDEDRCKVIADQIVECGTEKAYGEKFSEYPHFLEDYSKFYFDHAQEICGLLRERKEVVSASEPSGMFDNYLNVSFHINYCPRWQNRLEREVEREHRVQDFADRFIEDCANDFSGTDGETFEWTVTPDDIGEKDYLFIKDNRDKFLNYLNGKAGVDSAEFSMQKITLKFKRDYISGIADGSIMLPSEHSRLVREIADKIISEGTENTTEGNWIKPFSDFGANAEFAMLNAEDIATELCKHQEVSDVELDDECFDTNFYTDYCPNYIPKDGEDGYGDDDEDEVLLPDSPLDTEEFVRDAGELAELKELYAESFAGRAEEQDKTQDRHPQLIVIDSDEPTPFDAEQELKDDRRKELAAELGEADEDNDFDEDYDEDEESSDEQDGDYEEESRQPEEKVKPAPKKQEKGIKDRKRKQNPQLNLFEIYEPKEQPQREQMIERQLKLGSRVEHGKFRIFDKYNENPTVKTFAEFLKKEYGIGGFSCGADRQNHDGKGVKMALYAEDNQRIEEVFLKWNEVAVRIADLIDGDNYFSEREKKEYVEYRTEQNRLEALRKEEERQNNELVNKFIFNADSGRKQRILDEYAKTTKLLQFAEFLKNEYGTHEEQGDGYYAIYNSLGLWFGRGEKNYDYQDKIILKWEEFADKVCDLIENDRYIEQFDEQDEKAIFNPFKELSADGKAFFDRYQQRNIREPVNSPWHEVQSCQVIANGIYSVSTAEHGGVMITAELAPHILSPEALQKGVRDGGYYCFEEDCDASIPLRELYDKGILGRTNVYFTKSYIKSDKAESGYIPFTDLSEQEKDEFFNDWDKTLNESLAQWNPEYWAAREDKERGNGECAAENSYGGQEAENTDLNGVLNQSELGGQKSRFQGNVAAIRLVKKLYAENRNPTQEEKKILSQFVGWGGLPQAFDENNKHWRREYNELKGLLSSEDYEQAKSSTLNAYYTPKEVIRGIYAALERFGVKGNNRILEPSMGTGNFFGYMPKEVADGSRLYGVELDNVTGRIAAKLYPQANVQIKGFEDTSFPNDKFDIVVGNVPFGGYGVADSGYNRYNFKVHDYFLAKSIDKVKPNGIVAIVTSKGTMDKFNPSARKYVAERAELLGAIRLPDTAFKQTAGTEAVADILFLRKYTDKISVDAENTEWLSAGKTEEGYELNNYFIKHPEMVLGTLTKSVGLYGGEDITVEADGRSLSEALTAALQNLPQNFFESSETPPEEERLTEADYNVKPLCYKADGGRLYMRIGDEMVEQAVPQTPNDAYQRIKAMIALREELHHILDIQKQGCSDEVLEEEQERLNAQYDLFVRKYGNLNSKTNTRLFRDDGDSALLFSCEDIDRETSAITKADVFTKRTIRPYVVPTSTDDCFEALQISKNERGRVDISYIEELTNKTYDTVIKELGDAVFRNPEKTDMEDKYSGFETAEEYLSGKVVEKLNAARKIAEKYPEYGRNVAALEQVQPTPITASEISVRPGASWIDKEYYKQFYLELIDAPWFLRSEVELFYNPFDSSWRLDQEPRVRTFTNMKQKQVYGTSRAPAYRLFVDALNQKTTTIYDTVEEDGREKRVVNQAETIAAREKQNKIKEEFRNWIFADPERREELEATYNRLFNKIRLPVYDGSYLQFPEINPAIELHPHQKDAIHRIIVSGGSTLLHHVVGSGKTYTIAASVMKMRQLGLCKKTMIAVPNHLVQQWAGEWRKLYPNAKLLIATKEDLEKNNRKKFVSKVALGDWDAVIIAQSAFAKINISYGRQEKKLREEIASIELTIEKQWEENGMPRGAVKNLQKLKKSREAALKKLMADEKKDNVLKFEDLGIDYLFIDEAHYYKNKFLFTKMNNVAGISNAASQRATDLQLKCDYLQELHGSDRGIVFATGTPISNSMTEMYTMQSYLQPSVLKENGINFFDGWAADFGETVTSFELSPGGQGYRSRQRFAKFTNLPELQTMYRSFADVITSDMVRLDVPKAERHVITLKPSDTVIELAKEIAARAERIYRGGVDPSIDNMLKVTSDGKKLALDPRCFVPESEDEAGSKLNEAAQRIYEIREETKDKKSTQIVFCDLSTPKKRYEDYVYGVDFDAYNDLKYKLVQKGIPAEEVAFIHDANTDESKQALFDNVNSGKIRVLIGSTGKCGAGTNVQKRLIALHHLDTPYRPSDMEQREGRIIRQGNTNDTVRIYTYVMERTFDSYSYQILENKQRFISQICNGDFMAREFEDTDETTLSYAEIKAITAANPKIKRKMEVDTEISRLRTLEGQYKKNKYDLQDRIRKRFPEEIKKQEFLIERVTKDLELLNEYKPDNAEEFSISVNGKVYTDKKEGGKALTDALYQSRPETVVAEYCGFKISMTPMTSLDGGRDITLAATGQYALDIGESASGNLTRLNNFIEDLPKRRERLENKLRQLKSDLEIAKEQVEKPFEQEEQLLRLLSEQSELNAELNLDKKQESVIIDDGEDTDEEDNYRMIPERYKEVGIIDGEDKVAAMKIDVLPDYTVTREDMHRYGYTWNGMLPLSRDSALRLWGMGLEVHKLFPNDTEMTVKNYGDMNPHEMDLYGIEKPVWKNFLENEKSTPYFTARLHIASAAWNTVSEEMTDVEESFKDKFMDGCFKERAALEDYLPYKKPPENEEVQGYLPRVLDEFTERLWDDDLKYYGWSETDVYRSIAEHIADGELKAYIKQSLQPFNAESGLMKALDKFSEDEIEELDLPAFDDTLTVLDKVADRPLNERETLPGLLLLQNDEVSEWYVINDTSARGKDGKPLEAGDKTDVMTVLAYNGLYGGNPLRTFYDKTRARMYFNEKAAVTGGLKGGETMQEIKETDYEKEVIDSVNAEFEAFKAETLKRPPEDIFYENYKIHVFTELQDVIAAKGEDGYLEPKHYRALYEERGHILQELYDDFIGAEDASLNSMGDTAEFIENYCEKYHEDVMYPAVYYGKDTENTAYYRFTAGLSYDTMPQITEEADSYVIAAPAMYLPQEYLKEHNIFFLKIGRDISEDELADDNKATDNMQTAVHKVLTARRREYLDRLNHHTECKSAIEEAIRNNYDGMHLKDDFDVLLARYGIDEIRYVLANTVQYYHDDGRISGENKAWANEVEITEREGHRYQFTLNTHLAVLDGFIDIIRRKEKEFKDTKHAAYYTLKAGDENGKTVYTPVFIDEETGETGSLFRRSFDTEEEVYAMVAKINGANDVPRRYYLSYVPPEEFDALRGEIVKAQTNKTLQGKFLKETKQGYKVLSITKDEFERNIAVICRPDTNDYIVAAGYDTADGQWAQGIYVATKEEAEQTRKENYGGRPPIYENTEENNLAENNDKKWVEVYVSRDALIKKYDKSSFMRMPATSKEYGGCTYNVFNNRIKESTQLTDAQSDEREQCLKILLREDETVLLKARGRDDIELTAQEFKDVVNHTTDKDYERKERTDRIRIEIPQEAIIGDYENSTLFAVPASSEYKGYVYYLPNSVIHENTAKEDGSVYASLGEDFTVTLRKGEEEKKLTAKEYAAMLGGAKAEDYKREPAATDYTEEVQGGEDKKWLTIPLSEEAVIANYEKSTLLKMPKGKYEGLVYYVPNGMVKKEDDNLSLRIPEDFEIRLRDSLNGENINLTVEEFIAAVENGDYENVYRRPGEEAVKQFEKVERQLRANVPEEMKNKPNWVVVQTRENEDTGRLDKRLIDVHTGKFAESDNPETWADFNTACEYAKTKGGVCLAYALDGKDNIACIDLDGCMQENGDFSELANEAFNTAKGSYTEKSVSGKGLHIFGKTKGADLRSFSKDGDMEYYQSGHFIAMTGDYYGSSELKSFDTPEMKTLLERKLERRQEWKNAGKGIDGITSMDDREMLDKAFSASNGDIVKRLYNGEDVRHNRSNSDMSLMNYLAFWSGHDMDQMLRVFATSGLYRPDKPQSYYEHTAIKAVKGTPVYTPPKASNSAPKAASNSGKDGK